MTMTTVVICKGGRSSEHEVSLSSAAGVIAALSTEQFTVLDVLIDRNGHWTHNGEPVVLAPAAGSAHGRLIDAAGRTVAEVDVVFPVLHGPYGEDGTIQGLCEMIGVPCVGAGVAASAIGMDKVMFKTIARAHGLPVADAITVDQRTWPQVRATILEETAALGYPVYVKPARLGSSVGISRVTGPHDLIAAIDLALGHDSKVLVEKGIDGREIEVGIFGTETLTISPPGEIAYGSDWYDYTTKYQQGLAALQIPADLPIEVVARTKELAEIAYRAIDCAGMGRIDCFVTPDGEIVLSEINTIPGFTPTSAYPSLMAAAGIPYPDLLAGLITDAIARATSAHQFAR